eukprot:1010790-Rhodomonas_salina.1
MSQLHTGAAVQREMTCLGGEFQLASPGRSIRSLSIAHRTTHDLGSSICYFNIAQYAACSIHYLSIAHRIVHGSSICFLTIQVMWQCMKVFVGVSCVFFRGVLDTPGMKVEVG